MAPTPDRERKERKQLTCSTCGAGNRLAPAVVDRGFQRCSHCDSAMPVAGAGSFAVEHRAAGFTRVISPGRSLFVLLLGRVVHLPFFILYLLFGDALTSIFRKVTLHWGAPELVAWAPTVLYLAGGLVLLLQLLTQQRILATSNRVEISWHLFGLRVRHRRFGTHGLELEVMESKWKGGLLATPRGQKPMPTPS